MKSLVSNHSGIHSGVRDRCVARSQLGQNFGGNRSSSRDVADGKNVDWSRLGQLGEGASAGQRQWPEF